MRSTRRLLETIVAVLVLRTAASAAVPPRTATPTRRAALVGLGAVVTAVVTPLALPPIVGSVAKRATSTLEDGFAPEPAARLDKLLRSGRRGTATLDADGTLWGHDVSYGFARWALAGRHLDPARADALTRDMKALEAGELGDDQMISRLASAWSGLPVDRARLLARRYFDQEHRRHIFAPMAGLVVRLREAGITPWIVSGSQDFLVEAGARHLGIPPEHVIAVQAETEGGVFTDRLIQPVPWKIGKAQQIALRMGPRPPLFAAGNGSGDLWMLRMASDLVLVVNPGAELLKEALEKQWPIERWPEL
jgi:phosphoserine phosphatase